MQETKPIQSALISVYHKDGLDEIVQTLHQLNIKIYSTGGTFDFIKKLNIPCNAVEELTTYPEILGGRVKTLHPAVFGGILARRDNKEDLQQLKTHNIPKIDLIIVDLYPFEATVASGAPEQDIIEKIDIGGISLIRAAAKNFKDTLIIASINDYSVFHDLLKENKGIFTLAQKKDFAGKAFNISSHYDTAIFNYFSKDTENGIAFKSSIQKAQILRYGENPHQGGIFYGDLDAMFDKLHGKELSYNNLLDVDAAVNLMSDFSNDRPTFAILKHNNACGIAVRSKIIDAWKDALAGDPVSAFGGILISNTKIDIVTAEEVNKLFFEIIIAPGYDPEALKILESKKNRIILVKKDIDLPIKQFRTVLNGVLEQDKDLQVDTEKNFKTVTNKKPTKVELTDMAFANILVKHTKSNAIVLAKNNQLLASGTGQTSRVDALNQAIHKARHFGFDLKGAVMASDAFFPFPDCVEIAKNAGITAVVQPGGSIKDQESIDYCNSNDMTMALTGYRHFKH